MNVYIVQMRREERNSEGWMHLNTYIDLVFKDEKEADKYCQDGNKRYEHRRERMLFSYHSRQLQEGK